MKMIENGKIEVKKGTVIHEGIHVDALKKRVEITIWCKDAKECKLCLYEGKKRLYRIPMFPMMEEGAPDLFNVCLEGEELVSFLKRCEYVFEADRKLVQMPYVKATAGRDVFGHKSTGVRGRFAMDSFDWKGENRRSIPYQDMILYQCHLRGFTKHSSSGVKYPGTYRGFCEKLDDICRLGVNTILFLPLYDFNEIMPEEGKRINYWGYTGDACYFAPKASYAADAASAVNEMKQMVKEMHQKGLNLFLEMHFVNQSPEFIIRCLKYYVQEFHIDGFLVNTDVVHKEWIDTDPILRRCKFLGNYWQDADRVGGEKKFATFRDDYLTVARRYLKSDEGQVGDFYRQFKDDEAHAGTIHYITQKNGFTLRDLVSYDVKHNEANGEKNADGTEMNYSWNCGQEGNSRKKIVNRMRLRQTKNALAMLFLGLPTPMLLAGDEFGRTQKGNNNAYCQDNATTWVDWRLMEKNKEIYDFTKMLIQFRQEKGLYHRKEVFCGMDTKGVGVPDVSGHGIEPWEMDASYYSREMGILFYGAYFQGKSIYMIFNFHWDAHEFYLPVIDSEKKWNVVIDTSLNVEDTPETKIQKYMVAPRTVVVFESE